MVNRNFELLGLVWMHGLDDSGCVFPSGRTIGWRDARRREGRVKELSIGTIARPFAMVPA